MKQIKNPIPIMSRNIMIVLLGILFVGGAVFAAQDVLPRIIIEGDFTGTYNEGDSIEETTEIINEIVPEEELGVTATFASYPVDVVGTKVATSVTGVQFESGYGTTTVPILIGQDTESAVFNFGVTAASSTAYMNFSLLHSFDQGCDTASTSRDLAQTHITSDINWFDAGDFIRNAATVTSLDSTGTTTFNWTTNSAQGQNRSLILDGLNTQCLALQASGTSTVMWAQIQTKGTNF